VAIPDAKAISPVCVILLFVTKETFPEIVALLAPDKKTKAPPVAVDDEPATNESDLPAPLSELPTAIERAPLDPLVESPVERVMVPV
jgi:hypothetical protein